jgi:hypothetical protein
MSKVSSKGERFTITEPLQWAIRGIEYMLKAEIVLAIYWIVLLFMSIFVAPHEFLIVVSAALHIPATVSALLCLEFFVYREKHMTTFTHLIWQVPTALAFVTDLGTAVAVYVFTWHPAHTDTTLDESPHWFIKIELVFSILLIASTLIYSILFFAIRTTTSPSKRAGL